MSYAPGVKERFDSADEQQRSMVGNEMANMRVAIPGIIVSFNPDNQTASVQPAISENVRIGNAPRTATNLPVLSDVPVQFPRAGGYVITFPVEQGDECILVFGDMCIDGWWQSGGIQGQMETRRHDLSDAMAVLGISSVPRALSGFSMDAMQIRSEDGGTLIELAGENINIKAVTVTIEGDLVVTGETTISDIAFTLHVHGGVSTGGDKTEPPE